MRFKRLRYCIYFSLILLISCKSSKTDYKIINQIHYNIIFAPDLSDRISHKNYLLSDEEIAKDFCALLYPEIINNDAPINQLDRVKFDFINSTHGKLYNLTTSSIDLSVFGNDQLARVNYLGVFDSTSKFKSDIDSFVKQFDKYTNSITESNDHGSDIYKYLKNLSYLQIDTTTKSITDDSRRMIIKSHYENILVILTDGYIETGKSNDNNKTSEALSEAKIANFRKDFLANKNTGITLSDYYKGSGYKINPISNPALFTTKIIVMQIYDRGHTDGGNKNLGPTDDEIIKLFWQDWLINSGVPVNNIKLYSTFELKDSSDVRNAFKSFLNLK